MIQFHTNDRPAALHRMEDLDRYLSSQIAAPAIVEDAEYERMSSSDKAAYDRSRLLYLSGGILIDTPQVSQARLLLTQHFAENAGRNSGHAGLMLSGDSTVGKTTTCKALMRYVHAQYAKQFPDFRAHGRVPVVYIEVPAGSTGKLLMKTFADFFGLTVRSGESMVSIRTRVVDLLNDAGTQLIVVDELHNLMGRSTSNGESVDVLKNLHNDVPATFVYAGIDLLGSVLLTGARGRQIGGRFTALEMTRLDVTDRGDRATWVKLITKLEKMLPLRHHEEGTLKSLSSYLYDRTSGSIGSLSRLITGAAIETIVNPTITEEAPHQGAPRRTSPRHRIGDRSQKPTAARGYSRHEPGDPATEGTVRSMIAARRFRVSPRPFHRETTHSYTARCLAANFETEEHRQQTISDFSDAKSRADREQVWASILSARTGRTLCLDGDTSGWIRHADGTSCVSCDKDLPLRTACTLCSNGAVVIQHAHFDDLVCVRHRRWVGVHTLPEAQRQIGPEHIRAALDFDKLKRTGRLDLRLYTLVSRNLSQRAAADESASFPVTVAVIRAITDAGFTRRFFSPTQTFEESYAILGSTLAELTGEAEPRLARALWLYARATFCDIRQTILHSRPFKPTWAHDYPIHASVARQLASYHGALQPFSAYLIVTGDTPQSAVADADHQRVLEPEVRLSAADREIASACANGHVLTYVYQPHRRGKNGKMPTCQTCRGRIIIAGVNDIGTTDPGIAAELDAELNGGLTARHISASSKQTYIWRCPAKNHPYPATASNRTKAKSKCPVCLNRLIVPGINDLATTHSHVVAEFHPTELVRVSPTKLGSSSETLVDFVCPNEHAYRMRIYDRVRAAGCPECTRNANAASDENLVVTHPNVAAEWHPSANGELRPEHFTHGSNEEVIWLCSKGHDYPQRIDRRAAGYQCSVCSRRRLVAGINDVATEHPVLVKEWHPYLNYPKVPDEIFPGTEKYYWKCQAAGHKTHQSIPHRLKSRGCTECRPEERILR